MRLVLRPLLPKETDWEKITAFTFPVMVTAGALWLKFALPVPPCYFKKATGCPCAGCGATRATLALGRGDILDALYLNPLTTIAFAGFAAYWIYSVGLLISRPGLRVRFASPSRRIALGIRIGIGLALFANWLWVLTHLPESPWLAK